MADQVRIGFPARSSTGVRVVRMIQTAKTKESFFIAAGTAKGLTVHGVKGEITDLSGNPPSGLPFCSEQLFFVTRRRPYPPPSTECVEKFHWMLRFHRCAPSPTGEVYDSGTEPAGYDSPLRLTVTGLNRRGQEIPDTSDDVIIDLSQVLVDIGYPDEGHTIDDDEKAYFVAYGSTDRPILSAEIGNQQAQSIYDDTSAGYWSALFPPLTSSGEQYLQVTDVDNQGVDRRVIVD